MRNLAKKKLKAVASYMLNLCRRHGRLQGLSYPIEGLYWQLKANVHHVFKEQTQKPWEKAK